MRLKSLRLIDICTKALLSMHLPKLTYSRFMTSEVAFQSIGMFTSPINFCRVSLTANSLRFKVTESRSLVVSEAIEMSQEEAFDRVRLW